MVDKELIYSMEISDDHNDMSKMSNSHVDLGGDIKSMKSFKSKGSIKSEIHNNNERLNKRKMANTI